MNRKLRSGFVRYENENGPVITSGDDRVCEQEGSLFRLAGRSDSFQPFMDWRLSPSKRADDLVSRLSVNELIGLMNIGIGASGGLSAGRNRQVVLLTGDCLTQEACSMRNAMQHEAERNGLGIPIRFFCPGQIQGEPLLKPLSMAATFDLNGIRAAAGAESRMLRTAGISGIFAPRALIATDPRWSSFSETFGTSSQLVSDALKACAEGFQGGMQSKESGNNEKIGSFSDGISCVAGVWPGFSAGHVFLSEGRRCTGHSAGLHLKPFVEGAWDLFDKGEKTDAVLARAEVKILRDVYEYHGIIVLDWLNWRASGYETDVQALSEALLAGADLFAGLPQDTGLWHQALRQIDAKCGNGRAEAILRQAVKRVAACGFARGCYENPYADYEQAEQILSDAGYNGLLGDMRRRGIVLLKDAHGLLPLERLCDVNVVTIHAHGIYPVKEDVKRMLEARKMTDKPLIVILNCTHPMLLNTIEPFADVLLAEFDAGKQAVFDVLTGREAPSGLLPFQFPKDEDEIKSHFADMPFDMHSYTDADGNEYGFAYGRDYEGVIKDARTSRYNAESWDALDREGNHLGFPVARVMAKSLDPGVYHRVVVVYTRTPGGKILVTQRAPVKTYPYHWEVTGGSVLRGEEPLQGAVRELSEETGLVVREADMYPAYKHVDDRRHCIYNAFVTCLKEEAPKITLQEGETMDWRWLDFKQFARFVESDEFVTSEQGRYREHKEEIWEALKSLNPIETV